MIVFDDICYRWREKRDEEEIFTKYDTSDTDIDSIKALKTEDDRYFIFGVGRNEYSNWYGFPISKEKVEKLSMMEYREAKSFFEDIAQGINDPLKEIMTLNEASEKYGREQSTFRKAISNGMFRENEIRKSGGTWLIKKSALDRVYGH